MLLTNSDIKRIQNQGYDTRFFIQEQDHWFILKNHQHRCVFHDKTQCTIYEHKPAGCTLYPIVFNKDHNQPIFDNECPSKTSFQMTETAKQNIICLVSTLEKERIARKKQKKTTLE
jgi:Fe-S-cluster containining protein